MERNTATELMKALVNLGGSTNEVIAIIEQVQDDEEKRALRKAVAPIMSGAYDVTMHITRQFPDLDPDKDSDWQRELKSKRRGNP